jgi:hypothetical protein
MDVSHVPLKQGSVDEIVESEHLLALLASERYGMYYIHARNVSLFMSECIRSIDPGYDFFAGFYAHVKKHHFLALLSSVRLHHVQTQMDFRQVIEGGAWAAFALAHTDPGHFVSVDKDGILHPKSALATKRDRWLERNLNKTWLYLKRLRTQINDFGSHANIVIARKVLQLHESGRDWNMPFFDITDDYYVHTDLWSLAGIGISVMDLWCGANTPPHIYFIDQYDERMAELLNQNRLLQQEMRNTERFKQAAEKFAHLAPSSTTRS